MMGGGKSHGILSMDYDEAINLEHISQETSKEQAVQLTHLLLSFKIIAARC